MRPQSRALIIKVSGHTMHKLDDDNASHTSGICLCDAPLNVNAHTVKVHEKRKQCVDELNNNHTDTDDTTI